MKLLFVAHTSPPYHGAAIVGDRILSILSELNQPLKIINLSRSERISDIGVFSIKKIFHVIFIFFKIPYTLIFFRPDVIYFTPTVVNVGFIREFVLSLVFRIYKIVAKSNCKLLYHIHMRPYTDKKLFVKIIYPVFFYKTELLLLAESLKKDYPLSILKSNKVHFLNNYVEPLCSREISFECLNKRSDRFDDNITYNVMYFAHLIESKGYKRALGIAKLAKSSIYNLHFHFYGSFGSSQDRKYFYSFIEDNDLQMVISYHGFCNAFERAKVFLNMDVLILPTYSEGYPLTIMEAMSVGLPVLATDTGAIAEIINGNSRLIPSVDNEQEYMEACLIKLIDIIKNRSKKSSQNEISRFYQISDHEKFNSTFLNILHKK